MKSFDKNSIIQEIKHLLKNENIDGINKLIEQEKKLELNILPFNDFISCYMIVDCACKIGNFLFIELLLKLINHKKFPISPFIGKYGLIKWVDEISNYGINLFQSEPNVLNGKTILDFCTESNNSKLYKMILKNVDNTNKFYENMISNNFVDALLNKKDKIVKVIMKQMKKPKFRNMELSIEKLSKSIKTTPRILNLCLSLNFINPKTLDIFSAIKFCRPTVFRIIMSLKSNEINENNLKKIIREAAKYKRLDNLLILNEEYNINNIYPNTINLNQIYEKLLKIEELSESPKSLAENILIKKMEKYNKILDIGLIELPKSNTFLLHNFFRHNNFWILFCLPEPFNSKLLIEDEKGITPPGYIRILKNDFINSDLIKIIRYFHSKNISEEIKATNIIDFLNIINYAVIRDKCENDYIKNIFDIINNFPYIYKYNNKNGNNILHIITKIKGIDISSINNIINDLKKLKVNNLKFFVKLINYQNNEGETPIMNIFKSDNIYYINAIIKEFKDDINYNLFNVENNNLLHLFFNTIKWEEKTSKENNIMYDILTNIFSKNISIILQQNIEFTNPYILAAKSGCNIALSLMYSIYGKEILEKNNIGFNALFQACQSNHINTVRYLIEYLNYDINSQLKYNNNYELFQEIKEDDIIFPEFSTPLHIAGFYSSLEIIEYLIQNGANPFLLDSKNNDAISICLQYGDIDLLKYLFSTTLININSDNDKYLLSLVKNKNSYEFFQEYLLSNSVDNINIVDENINNLIILSCIHNNPQIVEKLIYYDFDLLARNKYGLNFLHYCCYKDSYSCAGIILNYLSNAKQIDILFELLYAKDNDGETPLHIASEYNRYSLIILFMSFFLIHKRKFKTIKNNRNLSPIQLSLYEHNFEITLIFIKFLNMNISDLLNIKIDLINKEFDSFMYYYDSGYYKDKINIIENKYNFILYSENKVDEKIKYKENYLLNNNNKNKYIKNKNNTFLKIQKKYNKLYNNKFTKDFYYKYKSLFLGYNLISFLDKFNSNGKNIVEIFFNIFSIIPYDNQIIMNLVKIFINCIVFYYSDIISVSELEILLNEIKNIVLFLKDNEDYLNLPFVNFIIQIIVSTVESNKKEKILNIFENIKTFREFISSNKKTFLPLVKFITPYIKSFKFLKQINLILNLIKNNDMKIVQLKYSNMIPPLLTKEIYSLLDSYPIINKYIFSSLDIHNFINKQLKNKNIQPKLLDTCLLMNEDIIK